MIFLWYSHDTGWCFQLFLIFNPNWLELRSSLAGWWLICGVTWLRTGHESYKRLVHLSYFSELPYLSHAHKTRDKGATYSMGWATKYTLQYIGISWGLSQSMIPMMGNPVLNLSVQQVSQSWHFPFSPDPGESSPDILPQSIGPVRSSSYELPKYTDWNPLMPISSCEMS